MNQGVTTPGLTTQGWIFMLLAWGLIIGFSIWCFGRVLSLQKKKKALVSGAVPGTGREEWATRIGMILAVAGNAIGLGNFLRFPVKAAANGGGAFMIPYFVALILLGVPLMWVEWTIGRYGGTYGHGTTPGMFDRMTKFRAAKYLGALGISIPFIIVVYYNFIEAWTLGYAWFSGTKRYFGNASRESMNQFLRGFQGVEHNSFFASILPVIIFLALALFLNWYFLYRGISKGIEMLGRYGMPILFIFGIVLAIRVLTLGKPAGGEASVAQGLAYVWNPDFSRLGSAEVWLVAAGQIFFTLSLGQGIIQTYASYLKEKDDVTLNGLTTSSTNELAEVVLGGTIAIPLAVAFFGLASTQVIAKSGAFNLGFVSLPVIFQKLGSIAGPIFGFLWFGLLFIAGITSSVAMTSPAIAFLEDEFKWKRSKAVNLVFCILASCTVLVLVFYRYGFLDELDYWAGTFGLVVFAVIEVIIFSWVFGIKKGWEEMHKGADLNVPRIFKFVIRYVTPVYMIVLLGVWTYQEAIGKLVMKDLKHAPVVKIMRESEDWKARLAVLHVADKHDREMMAAVVSCLATDKTDREIAAKLKKDATDKEALASLQDREATRDYASGFLFGMSGSNLGRDAKEWQRWWKENKGKYTPIDTKLQFRETVDSLIGLLDHDQGKYRLGANAALSELTEHDFGLKKADWQEWWNLNRGKLPLQKKPILWGARALMLVLILISLWIVRIAWKKKKREQESLA